ncbi:MAG: Fic family protein [Acidobacteria bacterium]|nr:Fic family protein [Acidobacteriota bacterium]
MVNILQQKMRPPWAVALERAQREFKELQPIEEDTLAELAAWLLIEHVYQDLRLDGIKLARKRITDLLMRSGLPETPEEALAVSYSEAVQRLSRIVSSAAGDADSAPVELTIDRLLELHRIALGEIDEMAGQFRVTNINPLYPRHEPAGPFELPRLVEVALEWFSAQSILELHPVEQAALVHLRLYDLQPFGKASGRLTRLAASLFTLRADLPPIIVLADDAEAYYQALLTGFQMATQPLVELFARSIGRTLRQMREIVKSPGTGNQELGIGN